MIIVILTTIISITTAIVHHHGKSHPQIAAESEASKDKYSDPPHCHHHHHRHQHDHQHHVKSHPQIAGKSKASKDGQYRGEETKKTNQRFRTNLVLHSLILCERKKKERAVH